MLEFRATAQNFSPAILEFDAAMRSGRLRHDGDLEDFLRDPVTA